MIERPNVDALMSGELGQWLESQNAERAVVEAKAARIWKIGIAAACGVAALIVLVGWGIEAALKVGFFVGIGGFGIAEMAKRPMLNKLKGGINGAIAKALGLEYAVTVEPGQVFERAKQFEMVPSYDNATFQDLWWGLVGGRPFTMHEARLTETRGSGKSRRTVTVFEGQIMSIGFNRRFGATTLLEPDGSRRKFLVGAEKEQVTIGEVELERIDMVHPQFEDRFTLWSNDQVEARYIAHPEYVERLLAVEQAFAGKDIRALFHAGDLLIVLSTGDLFESGSLDASDDRTLLGRAIEQFAALAELAVRLNEKPRMTMADLAGASSAGP
jgi:hypothetical protein